MVKVSRFLRNLLKFQDDALKSYAQKIRDKHVEQTQKGIDAFGKRFVDYVPSYRIKKSRKGFAK